MKKEIIFKGKVKPQIDWVGTHFQKRKHEDKFGVIEKGEARVFHVETKYGCLYLKYKHGGKKIKITIKEIK